MVTARLISESESSDGAAFPNCTCAYAKDIADVVSYSIVYDTPEPSSLGDDDARQYTCYEEGCEVVTNEFLVWDGNDTLYVSRKSMSFDQNVTREDGTSYDVE